MIKSKYSTALEGTKAKTEKKTTAKKKKAPVKKAVKKKVTPKKKEEEKKEEKKLTPKQELFCQLYATNLDYFGNWVQAYAKAYWIDLTQKWGYQTAKTNASKMLTNANLLERLRELGDDVLNDVMIDKELAFVATQRAELWPKMKAINEYNKLKQRIIDKSEVKHSWDLTYKDMTEAELDKKLEEIEKQENKDL